MMNCHRQATPGSGAYTIFFSVIPSNLNIKILTVKRPILGTLSTEGLMAENHEQTNDVSSAKKKTLISVI